MSFASDSVALFSFKAIAVRIELWTPRVRLRGSDIWAGLSGLAAELRPGSKIDWEDEEGRLLQRSSDCFCWGGTADWTFAVFGVAENRIETY